MDELFQTLGAVYGWCWCKLLREYHWRMLYWPVTVAGLRGPQKRWLRRLFILAGFMSQHRGLSWDRRSRKGLK